MVLLCLVSASAVDFKKVELMVDSVMMFQGNCFASTGRQLEELRQAETDDHCAPTQSTRAYLLSNDFNLNLNVMYFDFSKKQCIVNRDGN